MNLRRVIVAALLLVAVVAAGAADPKTPPVTNTVAQAEIEGQQLAQQLRALRPAESFTNQATLQLRGKGRRGQVPLEIFTRVSATNDGWETIYTTANTNGVAVLSVKRAPGQPNVYQVEPGNLTDAQVREQRILLAPFADSDFSPQDLAFEFFHWPGQKVWKKEVKNSQSCDVLESKPASVPAGGYSRVVSWIDRDTGGIVFAEAYDARGKLLKEFEVKQASKVNGQWRVTEVQMSNVQGKTSTLLKFDYGQ